MRPRQRIVIIVRHRLVELAILLIGNIRFVARPQRIRLVHRLQLIALDLLALLRVPILLGHADRQRNMVRIAAQDLAQLPAIEQLVLVGAQVQHHIRTAPGLLGRRDAELALPVRLPADRLIGRQPGAAAEHRHLVGHDERGIEPHPELADQLRVLLLVARQLRENSRVPERAIVPRLATASSRDRPIPLSEIVIVRAALS